MKLDRAPIVLVAVVLCACAAKPPPRPSTAPRPTASVERAKAEPAPPAPAVEVPDRHWTFYRAQWPVTFKLATAGIRSVDEAKLGEVVHFLGRYPKIRLLVEVHSDNVGSAEFNRKLTAARAHAIARALVDRGVGCERLVAAGVGDQRPIMCNQCDTRRLNRRVEIRVYNGGPVEGVSHDVCAPLPRDALP